MAIDCSLYLVTDSSPRTLGSRSLTDAVREAIEGGVTTVQYRDKHSETRDLILNAQALLGVTKKYGVPLIINDRVDVALAVGADGVHVGQTDMELALARQMLGPTAIIGVSCNYPHEAEAALQGGADYIGIGTIFPTSSKSDVKAIIGPEGCRSVLEHLCSTDEGRKMCTVAIGGINATNVQEVMLHSRATAKSLDGVAVVSAIMGADDPKTAAQTLLRLVKSKDQTG